MKKYRLLWDKTEEMNWLNDLAKQGWNLTSFGLGLYSFERCQPGEYVYEADLKDKGIRISRAYREILESQNIEIIPTVGYWFLVRRKAALGPLELYSDTPARSVSTDAYGGCSGLWLHWNCCSRPSFSVSPSVPTVHGWYWRLLFWHSWALCS